MCIRDRTKALKQGLCATTQIEKIRQEDPKAILYQIGEGGVFAALWDLLEPLELGMEIRMDQILICQETVEISEFYRVNPYLMTSCLLYTSQQSGCNRYDGNTGYGLWNPERCRREISWS